MIRHPGGIAPLLALLALAVPAAAQPKVILPPAKDGRLENLVPVPASEAHWVALSETHHLLAFCHERTYQQANLSLVRLDAKGNPSAYAISWKLPPRPGTLGKVAGYALSAAFHPKLPLLYVWQDAAVPYSTPGQKDPPDVQLLDHLLIYNFTREPPELVASLCRGPEYVYGQSAGGLAVDASGEHLYVPNLHEVKNQGFFHFGRFKLDADGLPVLDAKDVGQPAAVRVKKLTVASTTKGISPPEQSPLEYIYMFSFNAMGYGTWFQPLGKEVVLVGANPGLMIWRPGDKVVALSGLPLKGGGDNRLGLHPKLPLVYAMPAWTSSDSVFLAGLSDGYLTLLPRQYVFSETRLSSAPAVVAGGSKLAVGGHYHVYFVDLDDKGEPRGEVSRVRVLNPQVRALVYSPAFDRLYVGVEVSK
jgi:hypothetical protein